MSPEELKSLLQRRPFLPFRIHLTEDGVSYDIRKPEMVSVGWTILFIGLVRDIKSEYFDEPVLVAIRHITRAEPIIEETTAA